MKLRRALVVLVAGAVVTVACSPDDPTPASTGSADSEAATDTTDAPSATASSTPSPDTTGTSPDVDARSPQVRGATERWPTDWSSTTIDLAELALGIPSQDPRDAIPPLYSATYTTVTEGAEWLGPRDPGALVEVGDEVRFYPLAIMTRHEIVNDVIDGVPVAVTYCPLCNTALAFERRVNGEEIQLGVSGLLRNSDMVMWDHETVSLWQQITGEAVVGELAGTRLPRLTTAIVSFAEVQENFPDAAVLDPDTGFGIAYGSNPYRVYSSQPAPYPSFADAPEDTRIPALERVVGVTIDGADTAYPFSVLEQQPAINDSVAGVPIVVLWGGDTADALDEGLISDSRAVGTGIAFLATLDGQVLTFEPADDGTFADTQTRSTWTLLGRAVDGPLEGSRLEVAPHRNEFWFAFAAFFPDAEVYGVEEE